MAAYTTSLAFLRLANSHSFGTIAPYLARLRYLTTLELEECLPDEEASLDQPKPVFQLGTLQVGSIGEEEGRSVTLAHVKWLTDSSRGSLRHLELGDCAEDALDDLLGWGHKLKLLTVSMIHTREDGFRVMTGADALYALKLAHWRSLDRFEGVGPVHGSRGAQPRVRRAGPGPGSGRRKRQQSTWQASIRGSRDLKRSDGSASAARLPTAPCFREPEPVQGEMLMAFNPAAQW